MPKSEGWSNLKLGRGWNKGLDSRVVVVCAICGKEVKRYPSHIKSDLHFCSIECKGQGMTQKLTRPMRLGTGADEKTKYYKRKYYKYRGRDRRANVASTDYSVSDLVDRLKTSDCYYCGTTEDLGLDRVDYTKGHTLDNTLVACELCNMTRGRRFSVSEMQRLGMIIKAIRKERNARNNMRR